MDGTADRILDVAERLVQTQGFNAWSYADIAAELGVTKASLHYHFPTKAKLGASLVARYAGGFDRALDTIDAKHKDPKKKLEAYVALYDGVLAKNRMCLCGMLAAEHETLAPDIRAALASFFDRNEAWLASLLESGRKGKKLKFSGKAVEEARMLVGALEGAMLVARSFGDVTRFRATAARLVSALAR
ncbi:MAG TPA: TetR/AcrR family transcriptional regulator [Labilithrix sp.]|jgi:TetR/AcrR family transcriptional repressor of nem operon